MAESIGVQYFETSAKTGEGVEESIDFLVRACVKKINEGEEKGGGLGLQR